MKTKVKKVTLDDVEIAQYEAIDALTKLKLMIHDTEEYIEGTGIVKLHMRTKQAIELLEREWDAER